MNPYEILGVSDGVSKEKLREIFLDYAKKLHPDTATSEEEKREREEKFKDITYAYHILKNQISGVSSTNIEKQKVPGDKDLIKRAHSLIADKNYNAALDVLRQVRDEDNFEVHMLIGIASCKKKKFHESIKHFKRAIELNPWDAEAYAYLGEVYESISLKETAKIYYKKALNIEPKNKKALKGLINVSRSKDKLGLLKKLFKR